MTSEGDVDNTQRILRIADIDKEPLEMLLPISGYDDMPLVPLEIAIESLIPLIETYVECTNCNSSMETDWN